MTESSKRLMQFGEAALELQGDRFARMADL